MAPMPGEGREYRGGIRCRKGIFRYFFRIRDIEVKLLKRFRLNHPFRLILMGIHLRVRNSRISDFDQHSFSKILVIFSLVSLQQLQSQQQDPRNL